MVLQFLLIAIAGILIHVSSDEERWQRFKQPIGAALRDPDSAGCGARCSRLFRSGRLRDLPAGQPTVSVPIQLRSIHPAPPSQITFRGSASNPGTRESPPQPRSTREHFRTGKRVYYQNCLPCHGDLLDGRGHFGHGFNPTPLSFADNGTIAQLTESFVFWRIAKGGPGLPKEGAPWNSAMPVWEDFLTEDEIWAVIIFLYTQSGWQPRRWEAEQ